jgi:hypothetical protein
MSIPPRQSGRKRKKSSRLDDVGYESGGTDDDADVDEEKHADVRKPQKKKKKKPIERNEDGAIVVNGYRYVFSFTYKGKVHEQGLMPLNYPIPGLRIMSDSKASHFPPMKKVLVLPAGHEKLSLIEFLENVLANTKNRELVRQEVFFEITRMEELKDKGDGVYLPNSVRWLSPTLYGHVLIHLYKSELLEGYVVDRLGGKWTSSNSMMSVVSTAVVSEIAEGGSLLMSEPDGNTLEDVERLMKRGFAVIQSLLTLLVGPEVSLRVRTAMGNLDKQVITVNVTPQLRYNADDREIRPFFEGYTELKIESTEELRKRLEGKSLKSRAETVFIIVQNEIMTPVLKEVPLMKSARMKDKAKRQELLNLDPKRIDESRIWSVVEELIGLVFPPAYPGKWDGPYVEMEGSKKDKNLVLDAVLCLIQLCIGSRSRGVISVNAYSMFDHPDRASISSPVELDPLLAMNRLVTVDRITKEKLKSIQDASKLAVMGGENFADALDAIDADDDLVESRLGRQEDISLQRRVTKPVQYYFLDPMSYASNGEKKKDRLSKWTKPEDSHTHDPRVVFARLVEYARKKVKAWSSKFPNLVWEKKDFGNGVKYDVLTRDSEQGFRGNVNTVTQKYNRRMVLLLKQVFEESKYLPVVDLPRVGTHELRRLYVCYGYWIFAHGKMKEVSFARAVLMHETFEATLFYTSIQVIPTVVTDSKSSELSDDAFRRIEDALGQVKAISDDVSDWQDAMKREMVDLRRSLEEQFAVKADATVLVGVLDEDDNPHSLVKFPRKKRNSSVADRIEEGRARVRELRGLGIVVDWSLLMRLGMDTRHIKSVMMAEPQVEEKAEDE